MTFADDKTPQTSQQPRRGLEVDELDAEQAVALPEREEMSIAGGNLGAPISYLPVEPPAPTQ